MATKVICGLGNPGLEFSETVHNAGFRALDLIQQEMANKGKLLTVISHATFWVISYEYQHTNVYLVKPLRFMNLSGTALYEALSHLQLREGSIPADMLILHDELDVEAGRIKVVERGNPGNNNGCKNIDEVFDRKGDWQRIKIGAKPLEELGKERVDKVAYVLGKMSSAQMAEAVKAEALAKRAALKWITDGIAATMAEYNKKEK